MVILLLVQDQRGERGWEKRKKKRVRKGKEGLSARRRRLDLKTMLLGAAREEERGAADEEAAAELQFSDVGSKEDF